MTTTNDQDQAPPPKPPPPPPRMPKVARRFSESEPERPAASNILPLALLLLFFAFVGWQWGWLTLVIIAGLIVMIFLHELGHYVMAKRAGMKVTEFFLGFGPRIWSFRRGETEYGIKAFWLGAYVRIIGMHNLEEVAPQDEPRAYRQQPFRHRLGVAVAGSTMHFLLAFVLMWTVFVFHGAGDAGLFREPENVEETLDWTIGEVTADSAAAEAQLEPGDRIVAVDGKPVGPFSEVREIIQTSPGKEVTLTVSRDGTERDVTTTIGESDGAGFLGVRADFAEIPTETAGPAAAVPKTVDDFGFVTWESLKGMADKFSPAGLADLGSRVVEGDQEAGQGPVVEDPNQPNNPAPRTENPDDRVISILGAIGLGSDIARGGGWAGVVLFLAAINIFIGLINLFPMLPFDGGHVVIAVYEKLRSMLQGGRPYHADVMKLLPFTYGVVLILAFIGLSSIYLDIVDPVNLN